MPRFAGGNVSARIACSLGCKPPPPVPCNTRKKMSSGRLGASPHRKELAAPRIQKSSSRPAASAGISHLVVESKTLFTIPLWIPGLRFRVRYFFTPELGCAISPGQFSFRLQPVLQVIAEQSAASAVDLMGEGQNFFDLEGLADCLLAKDHHLRFSFF